MRNGHEELSKACHTFWMDSCKAGNQNTSAKDEGGPARRPALTIVTCLGCVRVGFAFVMS